MKHINCFAKLGDIDYSPFPQYMNTNLFYTGADNVHWLPVAWLKSALDCMELETCGPTRFVGRIPEIVQARSYEFQWLHGQCII
jgi:hypothetical protein